MHWSLFFILLFFAGNGQECPIAQYYQFVLKNIDQPFPLIDNPYLHPSSDYMARVNENLKNKDRVCALKYLNSNKTSYSLKEFETRKTAEDAGWIVTHQGVCGKCSTTKDLFVYLTTDLTRPVRKCGLKYFYSHKLLWQCIKSLGFTPACTQVWFWNTIHTKQHCGLVCLVSYLLRQSFVINGKLNNCLQCDQDKSGPIFKY